MATIIETKELSKQYKNVHAVKNLNLEVEEGAIYGFAPLPPSGPIWKGPERSPKTAIPDLYLASSYAGSGGFTGAILAGAAAADSIMARKSKGARRT